MNMIEVTDFSKTYGDVQAVKSISLDVQQGELFGLIGPDGAGKTTLLRTLCTLLIPDSGKIYIKGMDVTKESAAIRAILGYMPQKFSLYQDLTVEQNIRFFAELFEVQPKEQKKRTEELYQFSRLAPFKSRRAGALSGGMKQKLALSCALIHRPDILVLDEPTFGVDPVSRNEFWEILHSIRDSGTTIIVSTAYMDEANLCDRVALFFDGRIPVIDEPGTLRSSYKYPLFQVRGKNLTALSKIFTSDKSLHNIQKFGDTLHLSFYSLPTTEQWEEWKNLSAGNLVDWESIQPSIEDIFLGQMEKQYD